MINALWLKDFRNFNEKQIKFSENITVIIGPNASGKTNILEAINLLSTGRSFRAKVTEEMINYDEELSRIAGKIGEEKLEVILTRGQITRGGIVEKTARKRLLLNGVGKRLVDFSAILKTVAFRPMDLDLITESPSTRRRFLDNLLSQVDREYRRSFVSYEKGVRRRNKVLINIREEGISRQNLFFWDKLIIKNGQYLTKRRAEFVEFLNETQKLGDSDYRAEYDSSIISETRIAQYERQEIAAGTTLVGPHRDDLIFFEENRDLSKFGSRGEQRIGVLWLKLAELSYIEKETGEKPTLLLDDIFSELDHEHRDLVAEISKNQQTILTTADPHYIGFDNGFEKIEL
jgi:DNA replication and repair protein RecF